MKNYKTFLINCMMFSWMHALRLFRFALFGIYFITFTTMTEYASEMQSNCLRYLIEERSSLNWAAVTFNVIRFKLCSSHSFHWKFHNLLNVNIVSIENVVYHHQSMTPVYIFNMCCRSQRGQKKTRSPVVSRSIISCNILINIQLDW